MGWRDSAAGLFFLYQLFLSPETLLTTGTAPGRGKAPDLGRNLRLRGNAGRLDICPPDFRAERARGQPLSYPLLLPLKNLIHG